MLRIDLLPRSIAIARTNKIVIALIIVLLLLEVVALGAMLLAVRGQRARTEAELAEVTVVANQVRDLQAQISSKEADLAPIQAKIDFVDEANASGEQYWDRFYAINEYIYEKAQVTRFSITMPDQVNFDVIVGDTTETARFVLNLTMCPAITNLSVSGLPAGVSIEGVGGAGGGGFTPMAGMEDEAGMPGDDMGMAAPTATATATGEIRLSVSATLTEPVSEPAPGGGAPAGAPGMPGEGMPPEGMPPEDMPVEEPPME
ncbi:MAG: hypothetical protein GX131_06775 [candidate division WS1 bacterium]|nr:hypothetical protein [candidate division WS1 bacterium]